MEEYKKEKMDEKDAAQIAEKTLVNEEGTVFDNDAFKEDIEKTMAVQKTNREQLGKLSESINITKEKIIKLRDKLGLGSSKEDNLPNQN